MNSSYTWFQWNLSSNERRDMYIYACACIWYILCMKNLKNIDKYSKELPWSFYPEAVDANVLVGIFFFFFFGLLVLSRATPSTYGGSQARGRTGAVTAGLRHSHSNAGSEPAVSSTYTTAHSKARSLTRWVRPGIEPATSWKFLVRFVSAAP